MSQRDRNYHLVGWILFLVCAVFFISSALRNGDTLYLVGSIVFFVACIAFIVPLISTERTRVPPETDARAKDSDAGHAA